MMSVGCSSLPQISIYGVGCSMTFTEFEEKKKRYKNNRGQAASLLGPHNMSYVGDQNDTVNILSPKINFTSHTFHRCNKLLVILN